MDTNSLSGRVSPTPWRKNIQFWLLQHPDGRISSFDCYYTLTEEYPVLTATTPWRKNIQFWLVQWYNGCWWANIWVSQNSVFLRTTEKFLETTIMKLIMNPNVLLHERKRQAARHVASTYSAVLSGGRGTQPYLVGWGTPVLSWIGSTPVLSYLGGVQQFCPGQGVPKSCPSWKARGAPG